MPLTYPPAQPTLTGDVLSISRFLARQDMVNRRVSELAKERFVADRFLQPLPVPGSFIYSPADSAYTTKLPEGVNPGTEYPRALRPTGSAAVASIIKWGQDVPITDEMLGRVGRREVDWALMQVTNNLVQQVDSTAMSALNTAVTQTTAVSTPWKTTATSDPIGDVTLAQAKIRKLSSFANGGLSYDPDMVICSPINYSYLFSAAKVQGSLAGVNVQIVTGNQGDQKLFIAGMEVIWTVNLPTPTTAFVLDSQMAGTMAYENVPSPEYAGDPGTGIETWIRRDPDGVDQWLVRGRRPVVPAITDPNACYSLTGLTE
jgi:hypothetical protein